jgi:integrase
MDINNDPKLLQWLDQIEASDNTRRTYIRYLKKFCECEKKTPSELIIEAIHELKQGLLPVERMSASHLAKYRGCLKDSAPNTIALSIRTVKSFYKAFDIGISESSGKIRRPKILKENNVFIHKEDVMKLIANAQSLRDRSIILMMATSGLARNEIRNLRFKDISFDNQNIGIMALRREKSDVDFVTFISPEAVVALTNYLDERKRNEKLKPKGEDDYVFVTYYTGGQIGNDLFTYIFNSLAKELGYENGQGFIKSRSHALRKFFASTLENAGMPKNKIDFMLGHTQNGTDMAYFRTDVESLKQLYIKFLPYLTFEKTIEVRSLDTEDSKRLEELEKENERLKDKLESKDMETQELKNRLDKVESGMFDENVIKAMIEKRVTEILRKK